MHSLAKYLTDLSEAFESESQHLDLSDLERGAVVNGSVVFDPRNFSNPSTCRVLSKANILAKFGAPQQSVQYFVLTEKGYSTLFPA